MRHPHRRGPFYSLAASLLIACAGNPTQAPSDAGPLTQDAGSPTGDGGVSPNDGGDSGPLDAGAAKQDAGDVMDAGALDAGGNPVGDGGASDAGSGDAGESDAGPGPRPDAGPVTGADAGTCAGLGPTGLVISPYKDVGINMDWNTNVIETDVSGAATAIGADLVSAGGKTITLAFATGECGSENWAGVAGATMASVNLPLLNAANADYIVSTGGAAGAFTCGSDSGFEAFLSEWDSSHLIGVDFDIEDGQTQAVIDALLARIQTAHANHPALRFSLTVGTLAPNSGGLTATSLGASAQDSFGTYGDMVMTGAESTFGFTPGSANTWPSYLLLNLMTMDYGSTGVWNCIVVNGACEMGQSALQAAYNLRDKWGIPFASTELTPMIGGNDSAAETFTLSDTDLVTQFAVSQGLAGIHYWSYDRDVDCAAGPASSTCNTYGSAGRYGFLKRFLTDLGCPSGPGGSGADGGTGGSGGTDAGGNSSCDSNAWVYMGNDADACGGHLGEPCGWTTTNLGQGYTCQSVTWGIGAGCEPGGTVCPGVDAGTSGASTDGGSDDAGPSFTDAGSTGRSDAGSSPAPDAGSGGQADGGTPSAPGGRIIGYLPGWLTPPPAASLASAGYTNILVSFAVFSTTSPGQLVSAFSTVTTGYIQELQAAGIKVSLSIGGASTSVADTTVDFDQVMSAASGHTAFEQTFVGSVEGFVSQYGFDGIDIDIESGLNPAGTFTAPTGDIAVLAAILQQLHADNPALLISLVPQSPNISATSGFNDTFGNYSSLIMQTHAALTWVGIQLYNSGCNLGIDTVCYDPNDTSSPNFSVAMATDLLATWPSTTGTGQATGFQPYVSSLTPNQVVLGYPAPNNVGASDGSPVTPAATIIRAIECLETNVASGTSCDTFVPPKAYPDMGGVFDWEVVYDQSNNFAFATRLEACVAGGMCQ